MSREPAEIRVVAEVLGIAMDFGVRFVSGGSEVGRGRLGGETRAEPKLRSFSGLLGWAPNIDVGTPDKSVGAPDVDVGALDVDVGTLDKSVGALDVDVGTPDKSVGAPDIDVGTPDKPVGAPDKPVGARDVDVGTPDKSVGALDVDVGTPDKPVGALDVDVGTPDKPVGTLVVGVGTPDKPVGTLVVDVGTLDIDVGTPDVTVTAPGSANRVDRPVPVSPVERHHRERLDDVLVEAAHVHVPHPGVRLRPIEGMDAAGGAEHVLRDAGVERVSREPVRPAQDLEVVLGDDEVQEALLRAHRTVAVESFLLLDAHTEPHRTAVTAALVGLWHGPQRSSRTQRNPTVPVVGAFWVVRESRARERTPFKSLVHEPPRTTRPNVVLTVTWSGSFVPDGQHVDDEAHPKAG